MSTSPSLGVLRPASLLVALVMAASLMAAPPPAVAQSSGNFSDHAEIAGVHRQAVYALAAEGVVQGCRDGSAYCPSNGVTREQMASFIGRALGLTPVTERRFEDVNPSSTHGGYVGALAAAGITEGCPSEDGEGSYYCPQATVTREQMASFIRRAYDLPGTGAPGFDDVAGGTHAPGIAGVAATRVTTGCTSTEFCPRDTVTREQMASFIARAMGLLRDNRGCPTTIAPTQRTDFTGPAAEGFPVNAAERVGNKLYVFSLDLAPSRMVVYDLATNEVDRVVQVPTGRRTWAAHAPEGSNWLYFGQDNPQNLYRYNTNSSTSQPQLIARMPGATGIWDITSDDQGRLYIGTSRHNTVIRVNNPNNSNNPGIQTLTFAGSGGQNVSGQVTQLAWDDGILYVGTGRNSARNARLMAIDTAGWSPANTATAHLLPGAGSGFGVYSLEVSDGLIVAGLENWPTNDAALAVYDRPEGLAGAGAAQVVEELLLRGEALITPPVSESAFTAVAIDPGAGDGGEVYAAGRSEGTIYHLLPGATELEPLYETPPAPLSPNRRMLVHAGELIGAAAPATVWRSELGIELPEPAIHNLVEAGAPSAPLRPQSLAVANGHIAVGSNNSLTLHQESATARTLAVPGEPKAMQGIGAQLYVGLYPSATLRAITLSGAYDSATVEGWESRFGRPTDIHHDAGGSGRLQLSAQVTSNSSARGAVVSFGDPPGEPSFYEQPIPEQGASAITTWGSQTIVGGTSNNGRVASRPTSATSGANPLWSRVPVSGGGSITGLATVGNEVHGTTLYGWWFTLDPNDGQVIRARRVFDATTGRMVAHGNWLYAVTHNCLVAIDTVRKRAETLHNSLASTTFGPHTVAVDPASSQGRADVYVIHGTDLVRLRHTQR